MGIGGGERLITELYEGTTVNLLQCLTCGVVKEREESFCDLMIPVKDCPDVQKRCVLWYSV